MDEDLAVAKVGEQLRKAAGWENTGIALRALEQFPSTGSELWIPDGSTTAHWLHGLCRVAATAGKNDTINVSVLPLGNEAWTINVTYRYAELGNLVKHPALTAQWTFVLSDDQDFEVPGEIVYREGQKPALNDAEVFARALAAKLMGPDLVADTLGVVT